MDDTMPVFVKIEEYNEVLDVMNMIKAKLRDAKETLGKLNELKNAEDSEVELWKTNLEEIERKVDFVDNTLFEPSQL